MANTKYVLVVYYVLYGVKYMVLGLVPVCMAERQPSDQLENETERRKSAIRRPENERKVWAESYPGGDLQIEVGHMENTEELYLMSGEAEALREILNELYADDEGDL